MATPDGYALSDKTVKALQKYLYKYVREFANHHDLQPDDKIDHEEMHTTEIYIVKTPIGGIPANASLGSSGEGDSPGRADCLVFQQPTTSTESVGNLQVTVNNLSTTAIDGEKWIIAVRDKYGKWFAVDIEPGGGDGTPPDNGRARGPGWVAGLSNEDCLFMTVVSNTGKCSTIDDTQVIFLTSPDGLTWYGTTDFEYSGGSGPVVFVPVPAGQSMPNLTIDGYDLIWDAAGVGDDNNHYIDFAGGTSLCSDVPGTGSGTGGAREDCGGNIFIVRIKCTECGAFVEFCNRYLSPTLYVDLGGGNGTITLTWNGTYYMNSGGTALPCGETLHIRLDSSVSIEFSCNGTNWAGVPGASLECEDVPFVLTGNFNMDDTIGAACVAGSCGVIGFVIHE